jgi:hypothetical protein
MSITATVLILVLLGLMKRLAFLAPAKLVLFSHGGASLAIFVGALALNLFAAVLAINRKVLLKDTGRKLSHFDNQLQAEGPEGLPPFLTEGR